ncbi:MAG: O-Antigen ligase [Candidatus Hydrogenedentes bacterium ADurb.Bin101]|nr:MAG: O-Antigen ligase [Candidatus Hydrogenedentes bacterium ADurb.Bin101]
MNIKSLILSEKNSGPALFWAGLLLCCAAAWSFRLVSFLHAKDLMLALGLPVALFCQYRSGKAGMQGVVQLAPLWLGLLFWGVSGIFTAQVPAYHVESMLRLALVLAAASLAMEAFRFRNGRLWLYGALVLSGVLVGGLALLQYAGPGRGLFPEFPGYDQRAYSVFGNQNLLGGYMAFNLALLASLFIRSRHRRLRITLLFAAAGAILLGALLVSATRSAWLAAVVGGLTVLFLPGGPARLRALVRRRTRVQWLVPLLVAILVLGLGAPLVLEKASRTFSETDVGGRARLWFYAGAWNMVRERPWTGAGLGQFGYWSPLYQGRALWNPGGEGLYFNELHTDHAHSEPLEWFAETGLFGVLFWIWFLCRTLKARSPALPAVIALLVFGGFNTFSHSTPHLLGLLLCAAAFRSAPQPEEKLLPRFAGICCAVLIPAGFIVAVIVPSALLCRAEQAPIAGDTRDALYEQALAWPWPAYRAHESYAIALIDRGNYETARTHLEAALHGTDTGRVYLLLALCAEDLGHPDAALNHARACIYRWPGNEYAWSVLLETCPEAQRPRWLGAREKFERAQDR